MKVRFTCDGKNRNMFVLNSYKELDYIPMVGDLIDTSNKDFTMSTFRVKPWFNKNHSKSLKNTVLLDFKVVSRKFSMLFNEWELICEPTSESLLYLLKKIK